ncbi:hypothetical protein HDF24_08660 [Mucilaginibacter sp. X4EP1]|uniref:hypothetical protein n=1 Tax=Mucilaginibacter sp. X4EP1 TaxID=2723092 RepID=UPI002167C68C|nr:hypothetical protein [Mucilaginibacter sp. X4EP1]MCS3813739.1 hypothetical protein [Mucilaginibacter sp. X4EP1]
MKKITTELIKEFIESNKIPFLPTQSKLCVPIINRLCRKMFHGIKFEDIKVCDNLIINGHHRLSSLLMDFKIGQVPSQKTSTTKSDEWNVVEFDENDWDKPSDILYFNEQDAIYNCLDIEFVKQITLG